MLKSIMKKLSLAIIHPSQYNIKIVNQASITPMEQIKDLRVRTGGMDYQLNFKVLSMKESPSTVLNDEAYPLLLGKRFL